MSRRAVVSQPIEPPAFLGVYRLTPASSRDEIVRHLVTRIRGIQATMNGRRTTPAERGSLKRVRDELIGIYNDLSGLKWPDIPR